MTMQFSPELNAALHKLGFAVMDDNKYAEHSCQVSVEQRANDDLRMTVEMGNGPAFIFKLKPEHFINKADEQ